MSRLTLDELQEKFTKEKTRLIEDFFTFLRFESIATDPTYKQEVLNCHEWVAQYLLKLGFNVEIWDTENAPVIFATDLRAGPDQPTLLLYNHYDVQPVDPLNLWTTPPFEPTIRDEKIYARGASDNKGQCFYTLFALKTLVDHYGYLPINIKYVIEGEEESGSAGLFNLLEEKKDQLKAEHLLIIDSGIEKENEPAITLGTRGICCLSVTLTGSKTDLHSGMCGGMAYNPNRALVEILASLKDDTGTVTIPSFYDEVAKMPPHERSEIDFNFDEEVFHHNFGFKPTGMERGVSPLEANWLRPTLEINGISGGYAGPGFKTVIPAKANAKISCRLVPYQDPVRIAALVESAILAKLPEGISAQIEILPGRGPASRTNPQSTIAKVMAQSYTNVFNKPCKRILLGGSIPIAADLATVSGAEMLCIGVALPTDRIHAPDEHFSISALKKGFLILAHAIELLSHTQANTK
ncbi:MAG: dipeptidase [Chlamydiia bacterium]|nr:dipeptidase [Chlamydiia bacterium]